MECTERNSARKHSKKLSIIGREITSGLFYLNGRNINHTKGLIATRVAVIMNSPAPATFCLPHCAKSFASSMM
jgi:hypothetical protein